MEMQKVNNPKTVSSSEIVSTSAIRRQQNTTAHVMPAKRAIVVGVGMGFLIMSPVSSVLLYVHARRQI